MKMKTRHPADKQAEWNGRVEPVSGLRALPWAVLGLPEARALGLD